MSCYIYQFKGQCDQHGFVTTTTYSSSGPPPYCPIDGVNLFRNVVISDKRKVINTGIDYNNYMNTNFTNYNAQGYFRWPGSDNVGIINNITIIANIDSSATGSIKIYDITNKNTICEITSINGIIPTIYDMGTVSNVPTNTAVWEVQLKCSTTALLELWNINIK